MKLVSLVPSLTETLFALGCGAEEIIGRTSWCIHPASEVDRIPRLGGTKTPNVDRIIDLAPDLVLLEREENPREVYDRLRAAGVPTWVTHVTRVAEVPEMLRSLGTAIGRPDRGAELADATDRALAAIEPDAGRRRPRAVPLIWNEPLMAVGPARYSGDILVRCGFDIPDLVPGVGYPEVTPQAIGEAGIEVLLLTSEPHDFTQAEGEAVADAVEHAGFARPLAVKVDGEALTWFGSRTASAISVWTRVNRSIVLER